MPSIELVNLTKRFGKFTAVNNLSLKAEGSQCVGFLGPNGAGKTTTLKMLSDMIFPTTGECFINGISVQRERKRALSVSGLLIESPEIYPSLTPRKALKMVAELRGLPESEHEQRIKAVLEEVRMQDWSDEKIGKFSKGMKQRINIASALIHDPEVVILDEPTTGLDPRGMAEVRSIIRALKKEERLIFMSSHILSEVQEVCDRVGLVDRGKLLFYDSLSNVISKFSRSSSSITVSFSKQLSASDVEEISKLPSVEGVSQLDSFRLNIRFREGTDGQAGVVESIASMHLGLLTVTQAENALEEIYMQQISRGD